MAGFSFKGLAEFIRNLVSFGQSVDETTKAGGVLTAELVVERARPEIPVKTGAASESLRVEATSSGAEAIGGDEDTPYYAWLEYGGYAGHVFRETIAEGRYLEPARLLVELEAQTQLDAGLREAAQGAGLDPD